MRNMMQSEEHVGLDQWLDPQSAYYGSMEEVDAHDASNQPNTFGQLVRRLNSIVCRSETNTTDQAETPLDPAEEVHEYQALMNLLTGARSCVVFPHTRRSGLWNRANIGDPTLIPADSNVLSLACAVLHNASKCTRLGLPTLLSHHQALLEKARGLRSGPGWLAADLGRVRCSLAQRLLAEGDPRGCHRMLAPLLRWLHLPGHRALDCVSGRLRFVRAGDHLSLRSLACLLVAQADYALRGTCCAALLDQVRCPALGPRLSHFRALAGADERQLWAALQRWPHEAPLWTLAGCRLASGGRWRAALRLLLHAARLEGEGLALWNAAACLGALGLREAQSRVLSRLAARTDGQNQETALAAARALEGLGMHAEAARAYGALVQSGRPLLRAEWALSLLRAGQPRASLQACGRGGEDPRLAFCRGSAMAALGDSVAALHELRRALAMAAGEWRRPGDASFAAAGEHRGAAGSPGRSGFAAAAGAGPGRLSRQRGRGVQPESPVAGCRQGRGCPEHLARARLPGRRRRRQQQRRDSAGGVARGPAGPVTCVEASFTCPAFMKQLCAGVFVCLRGDRYLPTTLPQSIDVRYRRGHVRRPAGGRAVPAAAALLGSGAAFAVREVDALVRHAA
ncbi:organic solute carrier partner 1 isoform X3 [Amblyomma americanum]